MGWAGLCTGWLVYRIAAVEDGEDSELCFTAGGYVLGGQGRRPKTA